MYFECSGPGSSVGIATDYGLDGPGSNPGGEEIFRPSRSAQRPTQPSVKWVPGLSPGWSRSGRGADSPTPKLECQGPRKCSYTSTHPKGLRGENLPTYFECCNAPLSEPNDDVFHWHLAECSERDTYLKEFKENALSAV